MLITSDCCLKTCSFKVCQVIHIQGVSKTWNSLNLSYFKNLSCVNFKLYHTVYAH